MAPLEQTCRSGRNICTMRYVGTVAMDICPGESTCRWGKEPIMADQVDHAPRWQCGFGYLSDGVDRPEKQKTSAKLLKSAPLWARVLGLYVAVLSHSGRAETQGDQIVG